METEAKADILSIARVIVFQPKLFGVYVKDPPISCYITPVGIDWEYWSNCAPASERDCLYRFLNGETVVCKNNSIEFIVPQPSWDDQKLLDYLFFKNQNFRIGQEAMNMPVKADIIRDSVKLVRARSGKSKLYGGHYREFKLVFSTTVQLEKSFKELSNKELESHFDLSSEIKADYSREAWRALKTVAKDPAAIYCSRGGTFIAKAPRTVEEYCRIVERELDYWHSTEFVNLVHLAQALGLIQKKVRFKMGDWNEAILCAFFSESYRLNERMMQIKLPRTDNNPRLFVEDVRKAVAHIRKRLEVWQERGHICDVSIKFGRFELTSTKPSRRDYWDYYSKSTTTKFMFSSNGDYEAIKRQIMDLAVNYLNDVLPFLENVANFVDSLLAGTDSVETMKANLSKRVLETVRLSPADYLESDVEIVKDLANRCVVGV